MKFKRATFADDIPNGTKEEMKALLLERLDLKNFDIGKFSKIITYYAFRNGPVEDIHVSGKLSQEDMNVLNQFMVNRIAGILKLIKDERWSELVALIQACECYGSDWDEVVPDTKELESLLKILQDPLF